MQISTAIFIPRSTMTLRLFDSTRALLRMIVVFFLSLIPFMTIVILSHIAFSTYYALLWKQSEKRYMPNDANTFEPGTGFE